MVYVVAIIIPILFGAATTRVLVGSDAYSSEERCLAVAFRLQEKDEMKRKYSCQQMTLDGTVH